MWITGTGQARGSVLTLRRAPALKAGESKKAAQKATKTQRASRYAIARDDAWPAREQVGADAARTKTRPLGKVSFFSFGVTSARRGGAMTDELKGKDRGAGDGPCTGQAKGW